MKKTVHQVSVSRKRQWFFHILGSLFLLLLVSFACRKVDIGPSAGCSYTPDPLYAQHPKANDYQQIIDFYIRQGLPGISVYIKDQDGVWAGAGGVADIRRGIPFQPCTVAKVASITKMFVGTLTYLLAEEGKLSLDETIDPYLSKEILDKVNNCRGATIRQLMSHTTGIFDIITDNGFYLDVLNDPDKHWNARQLIRYAYGKDPVFPKGEGCRYSNTNYLLLGMVLDEIAGRPHHELVREKILSPLGLENTYYYSHDQLPPYTSQGYYDLYNNGTIANVTNFNTGSGNGYGGMFSNVFDIGAFIEALLVEKSILRSASLTDMRQFIAEIDPEDPDNDLFLGPGLMQRFFNQPLNSDHYAWGHSGRDLGYSANCFYFPNQQTICCFLVNYGTDGKSDLREVFYAFQGAITNLVVGE